MIFHLQQLKKTSGRLQCDLNLDHKCTLQWLIIATFSLSTNDFKISYTPPFKMTGTLFFRSILWQKGTQTIVFHFYLIVLISHNGTSHCYKDVIYETHLDRYKNCFKDYQMDIDTLWFSYYFYLSIFCV